MSVTEYDVVIIGAGMAGLSAGSYLASRGLSVALVTTGEPTACLSTGCIDVCKGPSPLSGIASLPETHPLHAVSAETLRAALDAFSAILEKSGLPYGGDLSANRRVLTAIGTYKTTCLVPETMLASCQNEHDPIHVVTFAGLKDFYPTYIATRQAASFSTYDAGVSTTMGIAARFEQEDFLEAFLIWLSNQNIRENKIAFPAVLGLESVSRIFNALEKSISRPVFEIPTLPPSMPGRRLFSAMKNAFRAAGGEIYWSWPVTGVEKTASLIEAVYTQSSGRPNSLNARAFILASGSFVGGGLYATRDAFVEKVFGLPVYMSASRAGWFEDDYFSSDHAVSAAGIEVGSDFRPSLSPLSNVFACGGILAHAQILKYGCGHGLSISTGYAAAKACEEMLA